MPGEYLTHSHQLLLPSTQSVKQGFSISTESNTFSETYYVDTDSETDTHACLKHTYSNIFS